MSNVRKLQGGPIQVVAVTLIAALAWRFGIRPLESKAMELRAQADVAEQVIGEARAAGDDIAPDEVVVSQVRAADEQLKRLAAIGQRQSRMHEEIAKVVQECGVRLASLEPRGKGGASIANGPTKISAVSWAVEVSGTFAGLTHLLDVMEERIPLSRVQSFRFIGGGPTPGAPEAVLTFDLASYLIASTGTEPSATPTKSAGQSKKPSTLETKR
jgi:hypothetical protein